MSQKSKRADFSGSVLTAFREDHPHEPNPRPTPVEATAIGICTVLENSPGEDATQVLERAAAIATAFQRPASLPSSGCYEDAGSVISPTGDIRSLAILLRVVAPRSALGTRLLDSLSRVVPAGTVEHGRLIGSRAMNSFIVGGRLELAFAYGEALLKLGRQLRSQELVVYGWRYTASAAFHAGNLPLAEKCHRRMKKHADRFGDRRLSFVAALTDGVMLGRRGDYAGSIERLWEAFTLADFDWIRGQAMANLGETLYRIGQFRAARAARSAALRLTPARYALLVNLGGYAVCSAALGDVRGVEWAVSRTRSLVGKENDLGMAQGLLGCADACAMVGLDDLARELYDDGMKRAIAGGYHDWTFRPNPVENRPVPPGAQTMVGQAERATQHVTDLAPDGVADDLELTVV